LLVTVGSGRELVVAVGVVLSGGEGVVVDKGGDEVVGGWVQVPDAETYPTLIPSVGKSSSVAVHQDVYGKGVGQVIVVVVSDVDVVPVTSHAVIVSVQVVLPHAVVVLVMKSVTEQSTAHIVTVVLVAHEVDGVLVGLSPSPSPSPSPIPGPGHPTTQPGLLHSGTNRGHSVEPQPPGSLHPPPHPRIPHPPPHPKIPQPPQHPKRPHPLPHPNMPQLCEPQFELHVGCELVSEVLEYVK
jgi:hypothetical protein